MKKAATVIPKTAMIAEKHRSIVAAARKRFLQNGYAGASMDTIADAAAVSVKTIYGHFANKEELFSAVMTAACTDQLLSSDTPPDEVLSARFPWFEDTSLRGLAEAGKQYLSHLLSEDQLALYRVVTRDADRFPELGRQYRKNIALGRTKILAAYLARTARVNGWSQRRPEQDAGLYEALLRANIFEEALHRLRAVDAKAMAGHARVSARKMWQLLEGCG